VQRPRQQVENQIKRAILDGTIHEGDQLPSEHTLAQSFSVSRATVREALRSLVESGLLAKGRGTTSGLYVQSVDHTALARVVAERLANTLDVGSVTPEEVSDFRDLLEVPSARLAASNRTTTNLAALRAIIDEERETTYDDPAVVKLNAQFHAEIANASSNRVLAAFVSALHKTAHPLAFVNTDEELGRVAVTHHISLYRAIEQLDTAEAASEMRDHLGYLRQHAIASGAIHEDSVGITVEG
jgi:DNA-binding FadR family transcriptional regulator